MQPCKYADDNTLYATGNNLNQIRKNLEMDFMIIHKWFHMKFNLEKCYCTVIGKKFPSHKIMLSNNKITRTLHKK